MNSIDETAQAMFGMGRLNPMSLIQIIREVKSVLDAFKRPNSTQPDQQAYNFTGQHTDIAFVSENGKLNASDIERISDENLKNNVAASFSEAVKDGYLDFDQNTKDFTMTQKGMEHINSDSFKEQFEKDQLGAVCENKARVKLRGNPGDLNIFRFTDSISLNHLAHSDPAAFKRVQDYFTECEKYGFVNLSPDGVVTPTAKCQEYLNQTAMKDFNIRKITPDNVKSVANEIRNSADKTADNVIDGSLNKAEIGLGAATKTVSYMSGNSSGTDVAAEGAKLAAQQAAKKAREAAARKAAEKAAAKAAAKTAAKSAASSTGYGAAVVAAIEVTSKGANALTKMETQHHKVTINHH